MHSSEQTYAVFNRPEDVQTNPEPYTVIRRTDVRLGSFALGQVRTRLDVIADEDTLTDEREKIIDSRPETD
jgi:hypothetical protein